MFLVSNYVFVFLKKKKKLKCCWTLVIVHIIRRVPNGRLKATVIISLTIDSLSYPVSLTI